MKIDLDEHIELRPCAHCGGEADYELLHEIGVITCKSCWANVSAMSEEETDEETATRWNRQTRADTYRCRALALRRKLRRDTSHERVWEDVHELFDFMMHHRMDELGVPRAEEIVSGGNTYKAYPGVLIRLEQAAKSFGRMLNYLSDESNMIEMNEDFENECRGCKATLAYEHHKDYCLHIWAKETKRRIEETRNERKQGLDEDRPPQG